MRYRTLGDSGLLVSVVGLGCNNFGGRLDVEQTRAVKANAAAGDWIPTDDQLAEIDALVPPPAGQS